MSAQNPQQRIVAYIDDRGDVVVRKPKEGNPEDMLALLSTLLAGAPAWLDVPPVVVARYAASVIDHICAQEASDE